MPLGMQQRFDEGVVLAASAARIATGTGDATRMRRPFSGLVAILDVTAAATAAGDTLDVVIQTRLGDDWVDVIHFTQVVGDGGTKIHVAKLSATEPQAMFEVASALAAGSIRHLIGDEWRAKWTVASATAPSFTFSVTVVPIG